MNLNGITNAVYSNDNHKSESLTKDIVSKGQNKNTSFVEDEAAVVYEQKPSETDRTGKTYSRDTKTIAALKTEVQRRTEQFRSLVEQLILKQGQKLTNATDIYTLLREGKLDVDPQTAATAREEISENGYWGVEQTSERLFSFATSLTGGDPAKAQEMKDAFIKGYKAAEKAWGGELPEISRQTYDATIKKFDEWMKD